MRVTHTHLYSGGVLELSNLLHDDSLHVGSEESQAVSWDKSEGVVGLGGVGKVWDVGVEEEWGMEENRERNFLWVDVKWIKKLVLAVMKQAKKKKKKNHGK